MQHSRWSSGRPGTLLQISYFTDEFAVHNILQYYFGTEEATNSQDRFPAIQIRHTEKILSLHVYITDEVGKENFKISQIYCQ